MNQPAFRADGLPVSREDFYRLACDPLRSVVIEACAGAGKTWILVSRILRALLEGARPQEILAITFTRKAASEMQQRLAEWLLEFANPKVTMQRRGQELIARGVTPEDAARLAPILAELHANVLRELRPVQIQTFHAWFAQLLRFSPGELLDEIGLHRDVELIETLDDHLPALWRRFHAAVQSDAACLADFHELCSRRGRTRLREWLEVALERRVEIERADRVGLLLPSIGAAAQVWPELAPGQHPSLTLGMPTWRVVLGDLASELARGGTRSTGAGQRLAAALQAADATGLFEAAWSALFTEKGTRRQLGSVAGLSEVQVRLERVAAQVRQHELQLEHLAMVRLSRVLLTEYAAYKRDRGLADMADLEGCALALLRDSTLAGWVQERLDARYRHVLIDEFQDTSPLQWHALHAWLMGYAGAGGGGSGQRPLSIFIVGDPKQSIYRFRRAEPRVFEAVRNFVRDALDGTILECDHTRRNAPEIVEPLNAMFTQASELGHFGAYRAHSTEVSPLPGAGIWALASVPRQPTGRAEASDSGLAPVWRDSLSTPRHSVEEVRREEEARRVAAAVLDVVQRQRIPADEVMVLCRKRQSLRLVAQALRVLHIPFVAVEDHALLDAPEVRDLVAVLDVLASPEHDLSLAQALRSPLFGASDDELMLLARQSDRHGSWWAALMQPVHGSTALGRASDLLQRWRNDSARLPPHDLLDRIVHQGQYRERVAQSVPADQCRSALEAIDALLAQALTLDGARYATPYNFVRALKRRSVRVVAPVRADAVQLLTVHGAKGLEARIVFVMDAQPESASSRRPSLLVDWPVESEFPVCCAFLYSESRCPESLRATLQAEHAAREREELNGLYVALTRAKERLFVSATQPNRAEPGVSWWDRVRTHAVDWIPICGASDAAARVEVPVQLKVLPRLDRAVATPAPDAPAGREDEGVESTQRRLGRALHRFLEWATPGLGRPTGETLSDLAVKAAREFDAEIDQVLSIGAAILRSEECARFFDTTALRWWGNEVPVSDGGEVLRIDRLLQFDHAHGGAWWVLDYKLAHGPEQLCAYREQLIRYREAVARLEPGASVRCAFVTSQGKVVEIG
jgi:ATP-dependent helicase/nuclease subunit A